MKRRSNWASQRQSYAGAVRQRLSRIERDISLGVRHEAIRQDLEDAGIVANLATFRTSLSRARAWWGAKTQMPSGQNNSVASGATNATQPLAPVHLPTHFSTHATTPQSVALRPQAASTLKGTTAPTSPTSPTSPTTPVPPRAPSSRPTQAEIDALDALDLDQFFRRKSVFRKPDPK